MEHRSRYVFGVLITLWLIFFWRQIIGGEVWYCCDNLLINVPSKVFMAQEVRQGRFPLWNPYLFSGTPFFADINLAVLHPFNLLYLVLPPFRALTVGILVLFLVGSFGMFVLGRVLRLGRFASLVGAIIFGFSGSLVVYANNVAILQVAVLVPWVLAAWIHGNLVVFVMVASLQVFSGHPQLTFYTWLLLFFYSWRRPWSLIRAGAFVFLCTAVQLVPFALLALSSTRMAFGIARGAIHSVHPLSLVRLVIPGVVGNLSAGTAWVQAGTIHGYVGFLPLLLAPMAWRDGRGRFFIVVAAVSLVLSTSTYEFLFRQPSQFLFLWTFGVAAAAMIAIDRLARTGRGPSGFKLFPFVMLPDRLQEKISAFPAQTVSYNVSLLSVMAIFAAATLSRLRSSTIAKLTLLGVLFADLYVWGQTNVTTIPEQTVMRWYQGTKERVASWKLDGRYRYYTDPSIYPYPEKKPLGQFNDPGESEWQFRILRPGLGMLYGLPAVDGYASMVRASYQQWFGGNSRDPTGVVISSIVDPRLQGANVRYIITKPNNALLADETRYRLLTDDGDIAVYEDSKAVPIRFAKETE